jgi:hypothetical protein
MNEEDKDVIPNPRRKVVVTPPEKYIPEHVKMKLNQIPLSGGGKDQIWTGAKEEVLPEYNDTTTITVGEVPNIPENKFKSAFEPVVSQESDFTLGTIKPGNYILIYNDSPVAVGDVETIKQFIILNKDIPEDEFIVLKKCEIKVGIFIKG